MEVFCKSSYFLWLYEGSLCIDLLFYFNVRDLFIKDCDDQKFREKRQERVLKP